MQGKRADTNASTSADQHWPLHSWPLMVWFVFGCTLLVASRHCSIEARVKQFFRLPNLFYARSKCSEVGSVERSWHLPASSTHQPCLLVATAVISGAIFCVEIFCPFNTFRVACKRLETFSCTVFRIRPFVTSQSGRGSFSRILLPQRGGAVWLSRSRKPARPLPHRPYWTLHHSAAFDKTTLVDSGGDSRMLLAWAFSVG